MSQEENRPPPLEHIPPGLERVPLQRQQPHHQRAQQELRERQMNAHRAALAAAMAAARVIEMERQRRAVPPLPQAELAEAGIQQAVGELHHPVIEYDHETASDSEMETADEDGHYDSDNDRQRVFMSAELYVLPQADCRCGHESCAKKPPTQYTEYLKKYWDKFLNAVAVRYHRINTMLSAYAMPKAVSTLIHSYDPNSGYIASRAVHCISQLQHMYFLTMHSRRRAVTLINQTRLDLSGWKLEARRRRANALHWYKQSLSMGDQLDKEIDENFSQSLHIDRLQRELAKCKKQNQKLIAELDARKHPRRTKRQRR